MFRKVRRGKQRTISKEIVFEGIGLHTGLQTKVTLLPAKDNEGINIIFSDGSKVKVNPGIVTDTFQNITIGVDRKEIKTIEHLFSVFTALGIDNINIRVDYGVEIPILDGSARVFFEEIYPKVIEQKSKKEFFVLEEIVEVRKSDTQYLTAKPSDTLKINYEIDFEVIGREIISIEVSEENFKKEICRARTFGFIEDEGKLKERGLALGANWDNVHIYSRTQKKSLNGDRYQDESVRHKVLDLMGAIAVFSPNLICEFFAVRSGHYIDVQLMRKLYYQS